MEESVVSYAAKHVFLKEELLKRFSGATEGRRLLSERRLSTEFGVSRGTVRQALTDLEADGVLEKITSGRGGYAVNADWMAARDVPSRTTKFVILSRFGAQTGSVFARLAPSIETVLVEHRALGVHVPVAGDRYLEYDYSDVAGIFMADTIVDIEKVSNNGAIPVVTLGFPSREARCEAVDSIRADDVQGAETAVRYLLSLGHTRIACITGVIRDDNRDTSALDRREGYCRALEEAEIGRNEKLVIQGNWTPESGYDAGLQLSRMKDRPTAVFSCNDRMAVGAMNALAESGLDVPGDVSVIGFDNIEMARMARPTLTTMNVPFEEMARIAVGMLMERIDHPRLAHRGLSLKPDLVVRKSCGPAQ